MTSSVRWMLAVASVAVLAAGADARAAPGNEATAPAEADPDSGTPGYQNQFSCIPSSCRTASPGRQASDEMSGTSPAAAVKPHDVIISSYQSSAAADESGTAEPGADGPNAVTGKARTIGAGMVVPAVQSGRSYVPPKRPDAPKPDTSEDDCMSCD